MSYTLQAGTHAVRLWALATSLIAATLLAPAIQAQPYTPESNSSIVDTLPAAIVELAADIRRQQQARATDNGAADILQQAMASYQIAAASGEARAYGRTQAILQRWPDETAQPAMYHILLAAVLQHNHQFRAALTELRHVISAGADAGPAYIQALMIESQIGLVIGDYARVAQSCEALRTSARRPVFINCQAQLDGVTGNARQALTLLRDTLRDGSGLNIVDYSELLTTAAVLAHRLDEPTLAEDYYRNALRISPANSFVTVNYGNLLLEQGRYHDLIALLSGESDNTLNAELSILLTRALLATGTPADQQRADLLLARLDRDFELAFIRNEAIPYKEYAQYALALADQPAAALSAAAENWKQQKEPSDTRLLASAAAANNDHDTLARIERWISDAGTEDANLQEILDSMSESTP
ncbi:hypothetical protein [Pseudohongiella sp.]|uniref:Uncharacterized protein n=1 Tax=marine sediment metagenome TaxID=412755 RepID=A0A0F9WI50_9ZZZZ|nr:hypothetical protein [Pseudohongiella sp.]HDZ09364.1 hypothetical protein [Pseudohongiella sp.]HEA63787.1 hypothetical protein [Pseudohongiella sp.]